MKNAYIFLAAFLVTCIVAAEVYIHQMKGAGFFQAPAITQTLWILEWLFMLAVACILGMAIGWSMQEKIIQTQRQDLGHLAMERDALLSKENHYLREIDRHQEKLSRAQASFGQDFKTWSKEKERLKEELASWQHHAEDAKRRASQLKEKLESYENEVARVQEKEQVLKRDLEKEKQEKQGLQAKLTKSFALPAKDDLKLIHGIGPTIEKKLNGLGIYSFRQISELTPRAINEVSEAIKFFPGRIERDKWVSQARNLEAEKQRQSAQ